MAPHAAPSREQPTASTDLQAGKDLKLGDFEHVDAALSLSEARIVLNRVTEVRNGMNIPLNENDTMTKTRDYLEIFSVFKRKTDAEESDRVLASFEANLHFFEKAQMKNLAPTCADEAKALIPSLEKQVEDGVVDEGTLDNICNELQKVKMRAELEE
ncbi:uncharacterized protein AB675_8947 [Cyphellophora attinorum]|jgi:hypothetical protein|uniref:RNA polymerase Rpb4/RPC9 core domain-containing protein n=1 Tax=Cyphellophora attinorum TaxID=1664694 RepID=A0A0N0NIW5_9EURO|nr:uncharacterized protein AB675_8947 [Phialophora attinorum]KPI36218.1 hypothetical protein AB675_8947 [Phialophora attinorum]